MCNKKKVQSTITLISENIRNTLVINQMFIFASEFDLFERIDKNNKPVACYV